MKRSKTLRGVSSAPAWFINHHGQAPDRLTARVACQSARAEYRAGGEVIVEPPTNQHRQSATWHFH